MKPASLLRIHVYAFAFAFAIACASSSAAAAEPFQVPPAIAPPKALHDGQHDFDYAVGAWKEHTWRLKNPLTGATTWFEMDGVSVTRGVLGGKANLVQYEGEGPKGHFSLISIRVYDPKSRQWNINFSTPERGKLWANPLVGQFEDGRGEFTSADDIDGRSILVRFTVRSLSPTTARSEQAFSADGGKTWETNWINTYTRISNDELARLAAAHPVPPAERRDFDFDKGTSRTHISRLLKPLTGSTQWAEYEGTHSVTKLWNGRADLVELVADGPAGHLEGMGLRLYDPVSHEWSLNWVSTGTGTFGVPTIGAFKNGRGEFYDVESFDGKTILLRNVWTIVTPTSSRFEQAFSVDGGKTWETNWKATIGG